MSRFFLGTVPRFEGDFVGQKLRCHPINDESFHLSLVDTCKIVVQFLVPLKEIVFERFLIGVVLPTTQPPYGVIN